MMYQNVLNYVRSHLLLMIDAKDVFCVIVDVSSEIILACHHLVLSIIGFSTIVS